MDWEISHNPDLPETPNAWTEADLVPISAIQHFSYCPRQAALIHLEAVWDENIYTLRGRFVHEEVDAGGGENDSGIRVERSLPLRSRRYGLVGVADVVEFYGSIPYPVDYKHGPRRQKEHDDLQLCAQAVCLEEMTGQEVLRGAIYHASSRRRREVIFDTHIRQRLVEAVQALRSLLSQDALPLPAADNRCRHCSLKASCLPETVSDHHRLRRLQANLWRVEEA
ncbi:MAG: CRISPR-associated protein Cas4 [Desulfobacca sp.]|uniref:CRISPR-associated protein Cas4 n=1 Tax=Desulfobacca sp. TaxID=2067990 RepID=UPI004049D320